MCTVPIPALEKWVENGSFNPEHMAEGDYSHSMAILVVLNPSAQGTNLESASIGLIVRQCKALLGQISTIACLINYACFLMGAEGPYAQPVCRTLCMIMGNYGGHMAFATDPPFCTAYALDFVHKEDPSLMTFRNQQNHPVSFTRDGLLVDQLLAQDCPDCEHTMVTCNGHLLVPRDMQFTKDLFPVISIPHSHTVPYHDPKTGEEAPFMTVDPFAKKDMVFQGVAGDLELYTAEEAITLRNAGVFKSSNNSKSPPKLPSLASLGQALSSPMIAKVAPCSPKVELDSVI